MNIYEFKSNKHYKIVGHCLLEIIKTDFEL